MARFFPYDSFIRWLSYGPATKENKYLQVSSLAKIVSLNHDQK
jgi:hypothetical protein